MFTITSNSILYLNTLEKFKKTDYTFSKNDFFLLTNTNKFKDISLIKKENADIYKIFFHQYTQKKDNLEVFAKKNTLKLSSKTTYAKLDKTKKICIEKKKVQQKYHDIIINASNKYGVESAMVKAIILAESSYNPKAVSSKGAEGLMQLMPKTAQYLGVKDSFNPIHNINGGVKYFKRLLNRFDNNYDLALAAYNAGITKVRKYKGVPPYKATKSYIKKVNSYYRYFKLTNNQTS
jgi:soluble lytic murein transglycosylase-like protein